jgi:hypothetical protein
MISYRIKGFGLRDGSGRQIFHLLHCPLDLLYRLREGSIHGMKTGSTKCQERRLGRVRTYPNSDD